MTIRPLADTHPPSWFSNLVQETGDAMVVDSSDNDADFSEMKLRLANLKLIESDLLRDAAEIEKNLAVKKCKAMEIRRQIEQLTQQRNHHKSVTQMVGKADLCHKPEERPSLLALIENLLLESRDGLTLAELVLKIRESGYVSLSMKPPSMVDQAIFRLKKKDRIVRNPVNLKFSVKEQRV